MSRAEEAPADSLFQNGARLLDQSKRLLFDLEALVRGGEPDAIAPERPSKAGEQSPER